MDKFHYCSRHKHYECAGSIPCDICSIVDDRDELKDGVKQLEKERDELRDKVKSLAMKLQLREIQVDIFKSRLEGGEG